MYVVSHSPQQGFNAIGIRDGGSATGRKRLLFFNERTGWQETYQRATPISSSRKDRRGEKYKTGEKRFAIHS